MSITGRRCSVDLDDLDLATDEARALGLSAGDDLELVVGRAGNAKARIAVAFAGGVDLGLYTVEAAIVEESSKGLARRGHGSGRSSAVLADQNQKSQASSRPPGPGSS